MSSQNLVPKNQHWHQQWSAHLRGGWVGFGLIGCGFLVACSPTPPPKPQTQVPVEAGAKLQTVVLRRSDPQGRPLWRLTAQSADFNQTRGQGKLQNLSGELFTDGKPTFKLRAPQATARQQGQLLQLQGNLQVTDLQAQGFLTTTSLEWRAQEGLLIVRGAPKVKYPQAQLVARQLQSNSRTRELTAQGRVVVDTANGLRLTTEFLRWQTAGQSVVAGGVATDGSRGSSSPTGVKVQQLTGANRGNTLQGQQLEWNLTTQTVTVRSGVQANLIKPELEITGEEFVWQVGLQRLVSPQSLQIRAPKDGVEVRADQGSMDLAQQRVQLWGQVQAVGSQQQSRLNTNELTWLIPQRRVEALGNVVYQQQQPRLSMRGNQAVGLIQSQQVVVSGGGVVTEIVLE